MNIDSLLDGLTISTWLLLITIVISVFSVNLRRYGFKEAVVRLASVHLLLVLLIIAISLTLLGASLVFIPPERIGVVISTLSGTGIRNKPLSPGIRFVVPAAEGLVTYPTYWQTYTMSGKPTEGEVFGSDSIVSRTKDGQEVSIDCSVIFRIDSEQVVRVHVDWQNRYIHDLIRPRTRGVVRKFVSGYTVDQVNSSERMQLETQLDEELRVILEDKGFILDSFVLRNIAFTTEYAKSVEHKQIASQLILQREYEGQARLKQAKAESEALQLIHDALKDNPDLLAYQYITKLSPNISVMLLPNNAPFILPFPTSLLQGTVLTDTENITDSITN